MLKLYAHNECCPFDDYILVKVFSAEYEWKEGNLQTITYNPNDNDHLMVFRYTYDNRTDKSNLDLIKLMYYLNYYRGGHYTADKSVFKGYKLSGTYSFDPKAKVWVQHRNDGHSYTNVILLLDETTFSYMDQYGNNDIWKRK